MPLSVILIGAAGAVLAATLGLLDAPFIASGEADPHRTVVSEWFSPQAPPVGNAPVMHNGLAEKDGVLPEGATVLDGVLPGISNLDPALLDALHQASRAAAADGVTIGVNSGWRSSRYQDWLLAEAISTYGSFDEASRWVATSSTSPHVSGEAVDVGMDAAAWLTMFGADYGLCQVYENESWHFELQPDARHAGCPTTYPDPTYDPRMR